MKVGTDGVILGAWANVSGCNQILDVGTGTGLIAIMCAQRSTAIIDALEIDHAAYLQAVENMNQCPWRERLSIFNLSFSEFCKKATNSYDLVVCNPPYFRNSLKPPETARTLARHDESLTYENLLADSVKVLCDSGRLAVIIPASEISNFNNLAYFQGLFPERQTFIRHHAGKKYTRCLAEYSRQQTSCITDELVIKRENNELYTVEFDALTRDFYLNL